MARCCKWERNQPRCNQVAEVMLLAPDGKTMGKYCSHDAEEITTEYREKLNENWTTRPLTEIESY